MVLVAVAALVKIASVASTVLSKKKGGGGGGGAGAAGGGAGGGAAGKGGIGKIIGGLKDKSAAPIYGAIGAVKSIAGLIQRKRAENAAPQAVDPEQRASQVMLQRRLSAIRTGTADQASRQAMKESLREGYRNMFRMGGKGRDFSALFGGYQQGLRKLAAQSAQRGDTMAAKLVEVGKDIAKRKRDLAEFRQDTLSARAEQNIKEGKAAANLGLAKAIGVKDTGTGGETDVRSQVGSVIAERDKTKTQVEGAGVNQ